MKQGLSLRSSVLLLAALNALLIAALLVWFVRTQLTQDLGSLLLGESRERITAVAVELAAELPKTAAKDRDAMLARYSKAHGVEFYLFHLNGTQVGGPAVVLPSEVEAYLRALQAKSPLAGRPEVIEGIASRAKARAREDSFSLDKPAHDNLLAIVKDPPFFTHSRTGYWVLFRMPLRASDERLFQPGQLVLRSESLFATPFLFNLTPWIGLAACIIAVTLLCWLALARRVTRSIATLAAATGSIARGDLGVRVEVNRSDELGQLQESLNRMAGQLEACMHGQRRFLRDAAHELRSPLARMQGALGNLLESGLGPEPQTYLEDLREEIGLMSSLTAELLALAREESAQTKPVLVPTSLAATAQRVVATENPGDIADVRVRIEDGVNVNVHPDSLFRGLSNVVRNAIRYAGNAGPVTLTARSVNGSTIVTVSDRGPGVPEEALDMIFTPFYRLDVSRDRSTGGNGLGMAIARSCIDNCEGTIHCRNGHPGLEVVITLRSC